MKSCCVVTRSWTRIVRSGWQNHRRGPHVFGSCRWWGVREPEGENWDLGYFPKKSTKASNISMGIVFILQNLPTYNIQVIFVRECQKLQPDWVVAWLQEKVHPTKIWPNVLKRTKWLTASVALEYLWRHFQWSCIPQRLLPQVKESKT